MQSPDETIEDTKNKIIDVDFDKLNIENGNKLESYRLLETLLD